MTTTYATVKSSIVNSQFSVKTYIALTGVVLILMMALGVAMRLTQAQILDINPQIFYQILTAHGIGMVAIAAFGGAAIMWRFLGNYVRLHQGIAVANLVLFLIGVAFVLGSIFVGGFAAAWTFLFPLPSHGMGAWGNNAAAAYLFGVLLVGVGFLLFYLETARTIINQYGSFSQALGWRYLSTGNEADAPPPTVIASTVVTIINIISILVGAVILGMMLINLYVPALKINPLLAKNLTFLFGHVFVNSAIYMAVITVYEILPLYTGRPFKAYKPFILAWSATCLMVLIVYPHHLLMDFAMPLWALVLGQIISYVSSLPVLAVTFTATLGNIYRSRIKWDLTSSLLVLSIFGWSAGVVPAVIDGTIAVNKVMHNTLWVPGHFHMYLLLGCVSMILAFLNWTAAGEKVSLFKPAHKTMLTLFAVSATGFVGVFLVSGYASVPRRWAAHFNEWLVYDRISVVFSVIVLLSASHLIGQALAKLAKK